MKLRLTKADMAAAKVDVREWEELCSSFGFRIEIPPAAHDALVRFFACLSAQRTTDSLAGRLAHADTANLVVSLWVEDCERAHCPVWMSANAREMLAGRLIDPIARTGFPGGRMPQFVEEARPGYNRYA